MQVYGLPATWSEHSLQSVNLNSHILIIASLCLVFSAYDKVCLSDVLVKWKQGTADGDVVIFHKPLGALENQYLPFVGK